ncbi:MAG TPA: FAD-dependent oxidoreductase [Rhodocyclaceae bacterium]|nr:FAD-dependent oxidoreductase [Rhodocyclaceae bacterium]
MRQTHYLIVGASHAALSALEAIRMADAENDITLVCRDDALPYSPTLLPYVVSGRSKAAFLCDEAWFAARRANYLRGCEVARIDAANGLARLAGGGAIGYRKLLVASGATPARPAIPGLADVRYHVLRTMDDAAALREALPCTKRAVVLGAGLIGMHAAENLAHAGAAVTILEREPQVLPAYFDATAAGLIASAFAQAGVEVRTGCGVERVEAAAGGCALTLGDGSRVPADLLLVGTGVVPATGLLEGSGVAIDRGVLVDDCMHTNVANIWAAGDVAQARGFGTQAKMLNGIVPCAVEQGRVAGMSMSEDPGIRPFPGGVRLNAYTFFGNRALSVGTAEEGEDCEVVTRIAQDARRYLKIVLRDGRLAGIFGINVGFDPGIMWELILRRIELGEAKARFLDDPQTTARALMSKRWR